MDGLECCGCKEETTGERYEQRRQPEVGCASASAPPACGACARIKGHVTMRPPSCCPHQQIFPRLDPREPPPVPSPPVPSPPPPKKGKKKKPVEKKKKRKKPGPRILYEKTDHKLAKTKMSTIDIKFKRKATKGFAPKSHTKAVKEDRHGRKNVGSAGDGKENDDYVDADDYLDGQESVPTVAKKPLIFATEGKRGVFGRGDDEDDDDEDNDVDDDDEAAERKWGGDGSKRSAKQRSGGIEKKERSELGADRRRGDEGSQVRDGARMDKRGEWISGGRNGIKNVAEGHDVDEDDDDDESHDEDQVDEGEKRRRQSVGSGKRGGGSAAGGKGGSYSVKDGRGVSFSVRDGSDEVDDDSDVDSDGDFRGRGDFESGRSGDLGHRNGVGGDESVKSGSQRWRDRASIKNGSELRQGQTSVISGSERRQDQTSVKNGSERRQDQTKAVDEEKEDVAFQGPRARSDGAKEKQKNSEFTAGFAKDAEQEERVWSTKQSGSGRTSGQTARRSLAEVGDDGGGRRRSDGRPGIPGEGRSREEETFARFDDDYATKDGRDDEDRKHETPGKQRKDTRGKGKQRGKELQLREHLTAERQQQQQEKDLRGQMEKEEKKRAATEAGERVDEREGVGRGGKHMEGVEDMRVATVKGLQDRGFHLSTVSRRVLEVQRGRGAQFIRPFVDQPPFSPATPRRNFCGDEQRCKLKPKDQEELDDLLRQKYALIKEYMRRVEDQKKRRAERRSSVGSYNLNNSRRRRTNKRTDEIVHRNNSKEEEVEVEEEMKEEEEDTEESGTDESADSYLKVDSADEIENDSGSPADESEIESEIETNENRTPHWHKEAVGASSEAEEQPLPTQLSAIDAATTACNVCPQPPPLVSPPNLAGGNFFSVANKAGFHISDAAAETAGLPPLPRIPCYCRKEKCAEFDGGDDGRTPQEKKIQRHAECFNTRPSQQEKRDDVSVQRRRTPRREGGGRSVDANGYLPRWWNDRKRELFGEKTAANHDDSKQVRQKRHNHFHLRCGAQTYGLKRDPKTAFGRCYPLGSLPAWWEKQGRDNRRGKGESDSAVAAAAAARHDRCAAWPIGLRDTDLRPPGALPWWWDIRRGEIEEESRRAGRDGGSEEGRKEGRRERASTSPYILSQTTESQMTHKDSCGVSFPDRKVGVWPAESKISYTASNGSSTDQYPSYLPYPIASSSAIANASTVRITVREPRKSMTSNRATEEADSHSPKGSATPSASSPAADVDGKDGARQINEDAAGTGSRKFRDGILRKIAWKKLPTSEGVGMEAEKGRLGLDAVGEEGGEENEADDRSTVSSSGSTSMPPVTVSHITQPYSPLHFISQNDDDDNPGNANRVKKKAFFVEKAEKEDAATVGQTLRGRLLYSSTVPETSFAQRFGKFNDFEYADRLDVSGVDEESVGDDLFGSSISGMSSYETNYNFNDDKNASSATRSRSGVVAGPRRSVTGVSNSARKSDAKNRMGTVVASPPRRSMNADKAVKSMSAVYNWMGTTHSEVKDRSLDGGRRRSV